MDHILTCYFQYHFVFILSYIGTLNPDLLCLCDKELREMSTDPVNHRVQIRILILTTHKNNKTAQEDFVLRISKCAHTLGMILCLRVSLGFSATERGP